MSCRRGQWRAQGLQCQDRAFRLLTTKLDSEPLELVLPAFEVQMILKIECLASPLAAAFECWFQEWCLGPVLG